MDPVIRENIQRQCQRVWEEDLMARRYHERISEPKIEEARFEKACEILGSDQVAQFSDNVAAPDCDGVGGFIIVP